MGEADTGVPCGALDDSATRLQKTESFRVFYDKKGSAILDGAAWVLKLGFSKDIAACFFGQLLETDERRLANS